MHVRPIVRAARARGAVAAAVAVPVAAVAAGRRRGRRRARSGTAGAAVRHGSPPGPPRGRSPPPAAGGPGACGELVDLAALGQGGLARQLDAVLVVDGDHLDQHRVADPADVGDARDVAVGQLADVAQAVLAGQDLDEGAEVLDRGDPALVDPADLDALGHGLDLVAGRLGPRGVDAARA